MADVYPTIQRADEDVVQNEGRDPDRLLRTSPRESGSRRHSAEGSGQNGLLPAAGRPSRSACCF
jgi:hypothetical protein